MHISDGVLPPEVWIPGCVLAAAATGVACRRLDERRVPELAVLTSIFFVASSIHLPIPLPFAGATSVHPLLVGLLGVFLGSACWIAIVVGLLFQALFIGHGGFTTLGVNALTMGLGAWSAAAAFHASVRLGAGRRWLPFVAGGCAILGASAAGAAFLAIMALGGKELLLAAQIILLPTLAASIFDAIVTSATVAFVLRARPEMLLGRGAPALLGLLLAGHAALPPALAHSVLLGARRTGEHIEIGAAFADGTPLAGAAITVRQRAEADGEGLMVAQGKTDGAGTFRFPAGADAGAAWVIVVEDEAGHRRELELSVQGGPWSWPLDGRRWPQQLGRIALGAIAIAALFLAALGLRRRPRHAS